MKICLLLMLIGIIVGFSHVPGRREQQAATAVPPEPAPANA
jgi:hypothetical protein